MFNVVFCWHHHCYYNHKHKHKHIHSTNFVPTLAAGPKNKLADAKAAIERAFMENKIKKELKTRWDLSVIDHLERVQEVCIKYGIESRFDDMKKGVMWCDM